MYLNTDYGEYLDEHFANGVPPSTVKTRKFVPDNEYQNRIVQPYDRGSYRQLLLEDKRRTFYEHPDWYYQSKLTDYDEKVYFNLLLSKLGDNHVNDIIGSGNIHELCMKLPADVLLCRRQSTGEYEIDFVHAVFPSGWNPQEAIGKSFQWFHEDVKHIDGKNVLPMTNKLPEYLATSGEVFERVGAFGFRTQASLHLHPNAPTENDFREIDELFVRFERQVVLSLPHLNSFLFFVQPYYVDFRAKPDLIHHALENPDPNCYSRDTIIDKPHLRQYFLDYIDKHRADQDDESDQD